MKKTIAMGLVCMSAFTFAMDDASNVSTSSLTMEQKEKLHTVRQEFRADAKEFAQEKQDIVQDKRQKLADFRKDRREDAMQYKKDCKTQIDAVETEDEKNEIKEKCKAKFQEKKAEYISLVQEERSEFRQKSRDLVQDKMESRIDRINRLSDEKKEKFYSKLETRLDTLEDKAIENEKEELLIVITELRAFLAENK